MAQASQHALRQAARPVQVQAIRFPLRTDNGRAANGRLPRLSNLLPRRWRRQVVIHGRRFWLPGGG